MPENSSSTFTRTESERLLDQKVEKLAIFTTMFGAPSQTFIDDHVRNLAPGRTVLLCYNLHDTQSLDCPVFVLSPPPALSARRIHRWVYKANIWIEDIFCIGERRALLAFLKVNNIHRVLAEFGTLAPHIQRFCTRHHIALYTYFRGYDASYALRYRHVEVAYRRMFRKLSGVLCVSNSIKDRLISIGCPPEIIQVNPSGAEEGIFTPSMHSPNRLLAVGRFIAKKAPHLTIEAFSQIAHRFPDARLDMIGDGPLLEPCIKKIADLGLSGQIRLHSAQSHDYVAKLMSEASIFLQHSVTAGNGDSEGLPTAIVEAMFSELPVVSTRHSGIPEVVEDGQTGILVSEHDVTAMSKAIAFMLENPSVARKMGKCGRARALRYFTRDASNALTRRVLGI